MDVFDFRQQLIADYKDYVESFIQIQDPEIRTYVDSCLAGGELWPQPLIQLNPSFEPGEWIDDLVSNHILHRDCSRIFRKKKEPLDSGKPLRLFRHQTQAVELAQTGESYVLSTGTGSGKSLAYIIPIVNFVLHHGSGKGIQAIVIYPMNALANSQYGELEKFIHWGFDQGQAKVKFAKYTGQENEEERKAILTDPPDILLTNYVMLELILTRPDENRLVDSAQDLKFLVLDELHTYRGRQGADVAFLVRRVRENLSAYHMQCIGTSATLASEGTFEEQQKEIASVASQIFGTPVKSENIIGESLTRVTPEVNLNDANFVKKLKTLLVTPDYRFPTDFAAFVKEPLSIWLESTFGVSTEPGTDRLVRALPKSIFGDGGTAAELSELTGVDEKSCGEAIEKGLLAGHICKPNPETGFSPFAFRLHQFISRGDAVYSSLHADGKRHITIYRQQFVPGDRDKILLPLAFCRECGQEYYTVYLENGDDGRFIRQRDLNDQQHEESIQAGFLYYNTANPWPADEEEIKKRLPDDWLVEEDGSTQIRKNRRKYLPRSLQLDPGGSQTESGEAYHFIPAPFLFCLNCGVAYNIRQRSDFSKLSTLSSEGRSTATTVLSLSTIRYLQTKSELEDKAKKLLSFTDNRQDASLQAGHFNDFIEIGALRSALYRAAKDRTGGLSHDDLTQAVFEKLDFPLEVYAARPGARFVELSNTEKAFRNVLGYRLYQDLKRGWRINFPNLEQCGLLEIEYTSLSDICAAEDIWQTCHPAIASAPPDTRIKIIKVLLDFMRRELAIKVDYLDYDYLEKIQQQSSQYLISPWALDEDESFSHAAILFPRSRGEKDYAGNVFLSSRGGYGLFLRRPTLLNHYDKTLNLEETQQIINELLFHLAETGLLEVKNYSKEGDDPGYQLAASSLTWLAGDGKRAFHDPIRVPNQPD
ncbi:MAG TPA: DEAD/DEAH box helicase, partial [bacterium]|nr:DEAD/DEAH box helicase [bacterium]